MSGWWDLNPRPPGPEPGAIPSFATARKEFVTFVRGRCATYFAYFSADSKEIDPCQSSGG